MTTINGSNRWTSTRTSRSLEVTPDTYPLPQYTSRARQTSEETESPKNRGDDGWVSTEESPLPTDSEEHIHESTDESSEAENDLRSRDGRSRRRRRLIGIQDSTYELIALFGLRPENIRQTATRNFKHAIRRVCSILHKFRKAGNHKQRMTQIKQFEKMYFVDRSDLEQSEMIFQRMQEVIIDNPLILDKCQARFDQRTCNDTYIAQLFSDEAILQLYHQHYSMSIRGEYFFKTFQQFKKIEIDDEGKKKVFNYCKDFWMKTIY